MKTSLLIMAAAMAALTGCGPGPTGDGAGAARQEIRIVGSSTVYPFTQSVAERFQQANPGLRAVVESTGTGGGISLFCGGVGTSYPDVVNASRRIKASEIALCNRNGVNQIIEVPIGIDGLALVESAQRSTGFQLTSRDVYAALAANPFGQPQSARTWKDVNPALPAVAIRVYGPPPTSGTRDSFAELILDQGCNSDPEMVALKQSDEDRHRIVCTQLREDGAFIEAGENDNLLVQRVSDNQGAIGVLGFSYLEENGTRVKGIPIAGIAPSAETIGNFTYPGARMLYVYAKGEHVEAVPGLAQFLDAYGAAWGPGGYLEQRGLIPLGEVERQSALQAIQNRHSLTTADLD